MGSDKLWVDLCGKPLIAWPLQALAASPLVDSLIVAASMSNQERITCLAGELGIEARIVVGGARRQDSVRAALDAVGDAEWVVVHDGARPLLTTKLVEDGLAAAQDTGAAIAAVPVVDTIKQVDGPKVVTTLNRDELWAVQTPQVFRRALLAEAHARSPEDVTDDAALVESIGGEVRVYMGDYENIKVTTPADLQVVRALLAGRA